MMQQMVALSLKVKNWYLEQDPLEKNGIRSMALDGDDGTVVEKFRKLLGVYGR